MRTKQGFTDVMFTIENQRELDCILFALEMYAEAKRGACRLIVDRTMVPDFDVADLVDRLRVAIAEEAGL